MTLNDYVLKQELKTSVTKSRSLKADSNPKVEVVQFQGDALLISRIREMGFYQGLQLEFVGVAPFAGPQLFRFGNTVIALRADEAACIQIKPL